VITGPASTSPRNTGPPALEAVTTFGVFLKQLDAFHFPDQAYGLDHRLFPGSAIALLKGLSTIRSAHCRPSTQRPNVTCPQNPLRG
jgi:hypothetical protein